MSPGFCARTGAEVLRIADGRWAIVIPHFAIGNSSNQLMKNKLVVVTDLGSLKAYQLTNAEPGVSPRLDLIEELQLNDAHQKLTDQVSDLAGRFGKGAPGNGSSVGERHNIDLEHRKRFVKQLTEKLSALLRPDSVQGCYFAASKEINHPIVEALEPRLRAKLETNLAADLTKMSKAELLERLVPAH